MDVVLIGGTDTLPFVALARIGFGTPPSIVCVAIGNGVALKKLTLLMPSCLTVPRVISAKRTSSSTCCGCPMLSRLTTFLGA